MVLLCLYFSFGLFDGFGLIGRLGLEPYVHDDTPLEDDFKDEKTQENG